MHFRTDISFLRALSVIIVMLFHFNVPYFSGGFIGVDVFFVISGFLMTQIIIRSIENDKFSLKDFYKRRAIRIMPPFLALLIFVLIISIILLLQQDVRLNGIYSFYASIFASNIYFWKYVDYFTGVNNILLHTWSLSVEWQFYLLYPLIILFSKKTLKGSDTQLWIILGVLTFSSFALMLYTTHRDNGFAFYMMPTRFWELCAGGDLPTWRASDLKLVNQ